MNDKLERLGGLKFNVGKSNKEFVLVMDSGLVKIITPSYKGKLNIMLGWNIYSAVRYLFKTYKINSIYRMKNKKWIKINSDKVKALAEEPMKECM